MRRLVAVFVAVVAVGLPRPAAGAEDDPGWSCRDQGNRVCQLSELTGWEQMMWEAR